MLRLLRDVPYIPVLAIRPAEMKALEELPSQDKAAMMPVFLLRQWLGAHKLDSALVRVEEAYGRRPLFMDLGPPEQPGSPQRDVHERLAMLRAPEHGYSAWCSFIEERENFVPAIQLIDPAQFNEQVRRLYGLGRGLILRVPRVIIGDAPLLARQLAPLTDGGDGVVVMLDYGRQSASLLVERAVVVGFTREISSVLPNAYVSTSASSFPDDFKGTARQTIYERQWFNEVCTHSGVQRLIYSDRGSARVERLGGGGGKPAPRIDYPLRDSWSFFRSTSSDDAFEAYKAEAVRLLADDIWDGELRLWGSQMLERTAVGDETAISSPARSTAVRINIHLHRQLLYQRPGQIYDTDEDWSDL